MYDFDYLVKKDSVNVKREVTNLLLEVQKELTEFNFDFSFSNLSKYNLYLEEFRFKRPIDIYVNIKVELHDINLTAKAVKTKIIDKIDEILAKNKYSYSEVSDEKDIIRIVGRNENKKKLVKSLNLKVLKNVDGNLMFIKYNPLKYNYTYSLYNDRSLLIEKSVTWLRNNMMWDEARDILQGKANNGNRKEDRIENMFIETLNMFKNESDIFIK